MKSKTIVHLIPGLYLGGSEKVLEIIVNHQIQSGNNVIVISFEKTEYEIYFQDITVRHCSIQYRDSLFGAKGINVKEYESMIDELRPDFIHSHSYWTDLISHYSLRKNITYISHFHLCYHNFDSIRLTGFFSRRAFQWLDKKRLFKKYRAVNCHFIAASSHTLDFYRQRFTKSLRRKIVCIPNPVDDRYFHVAFNKVRTIDLLSVGRLESVKDHKFLLKIVKNLKENGRTIKLAIVGEGALRNQLERLAFEYDISECVDFLGIVKDLREVFSISKIYIHTSRSETFGLAIFEAMAAGLPTVVRKFDGIDPDTLVEGQNSFVIDDNRAELFAEVIIELIDKPEKSNSIGENGRKDVLRFSSKNYLNEIDTFYYTISNQ